MTPFLRQAAALRRLGVTLRRQRLAAFAERCEQDAAKLEAADRAERRRWAAMRDRLHRYFAERAA